MLRRCSIVLGVLSLVVLSAGIASAVSYTLVDLGPVGADTQSFAYGVQRIGGLPTAAGRSNSSGTAATWSWSGTGFTAPATNIMPALANLSPTNATPYNLGRNGDIVGAYTSGGVTKAFYLPAGYAANTGVNLAGLGGSTAPQVWGTAQGKSVGWAYDAGGIGHAVVWSATGAVTDLGASTTGAWAKNIGPDGNTIVGDWDNTPGQDKQAAIWTYSGGTWSRSTPIPLATYAQSSFYSVNSSGDACGVLWNYGSDGFPSTTRHALLYKHTGQIVDLGDLGGTSGIGYSINDSGVVVGTDIGTGCFVNYYGQTGTNAAINLTTLISNWGTSGWTSLSYAYNVDNAGDITGRGYSQTGQIHGYMLVPAGSMTPEPSTLLLVATGLVGLIAYAWRKRK